MNKLSSSLWRINIGQKVYKTKLTWSYYLNKLSWSKKTNFLINLVKLTKFSWSYSSAWFLISLLRSASVTSIINSITSQLLTLQFVLHLKWFWNCLCTTVWIFVCSWWISLSLFGWYFWFVYRVWGVLCFATTFKRKQWQSLANSNTTFKHLDRILSFLC